MKLGNKEKCLDDLEKFFVLASDVNNVAKSESFNIADRNEYFKEIFKKDHREEYMSNIYSEKILCKYKSFLKDEPRYALLENK